MGNPPPFFTDARVDRASRLAMSSLSIKSKLALVCAGMFIALVALITLVQMPLVRSEMAAVLSDQQFTLVTREAGDIDEKLALRRHVLASAAAMMPAAIVDDGEKLYWNYLDQPALLALFDDIYVFSPRGKVLTDLPRTEGRRGRDISERDYFKQTMASAQPVISQPFLGKTNNQPGIMMTAPVLDGSGKVVAILGGFLNLMKPNFLGSMSESKIGRTGYFFLFTRQQPSQTIVHPLKSLIMSAANNANGNLPVQRALAGFEGTVEGTNGRGVRGLASFKKLTSADWILAAMLPVDEALAPIADAERRMVWISAALALLIAPVIWLVVYRLHLPLALLRERIRSIRERPDSFAEIAITSRDEIGDLTTQFNALMRERLRAEDATRESEAHFRSVAQSANDAIVSTDSAGSIVSWNAAAQRIFGYPEQSIIGQPLARLIPERYREGHARAMQRFIETGESRLIGNNVELAALRQDGSEFPIELSLSSWPSRGETYFTAIVRDITECLRTESALKQSEQRLSKVSDNMPALIGYIDNQMRYRFTNKTYESWYGLPRAQLLGRTMREVLGDTWFGEIEPFVRRALAGNPVTHERQRTHKGETRYVRSTYLPDFNGDGDVIGFYVLVNDISEQKAAELRLKHSAQHDGLTGLPNRALLHDRLQVVIERSRRSKRPIALMYLDIDRFKSVNDTRGHAAGDALLRAFAARLTACVRSADTVARLGGDEFTVLLEDINGEKDACRVADNIVAAMQPAFPLDSGSLCI